MMLPIESLCSISRMGVYASAECMAAIAAVTNTKSVKSLGQMVAGANTFQRTWLGFVHGPGWIGLAVKALGSSDCILLGLDVVWARLG
jgi:hypothetical protein